MKWNPLAALGRLLEPAPFRRSRPQVNLRLEELEPLVLLSGNPVSIGANLDFIDDWSQANVFVDMVKQSRGFTSLATGQPATVDANGWPTQDASVILQTGGLNLASVYNGTYSVSFNGQATLGVDGSPAAISNQVYNPATRTTTADVTLNASNSDSGWYFTLSFSNTNGGIQNLKVIRPGYAPNTPQIFTNQFLSEIQPFSTLRFLNWEQTNGNPDVNWSDRTPVTAATQATSNGVAWEYVIDLANATGKDIWINIPEGATDAYVTSLATLMKQDLDPGIHVYVEYSNELWNTQFTQATANLNAAVAEVQAGQADGVPSLLAYPGETQASSQWDWAFRRVGERLVQIGNDFAAVWGQSAIDTTIRPVLASQEGNPYIVQEQLQFLEQTYGSPNQYLYAIAGAPYFNLGTADEQTNLTSQQVLAALTASMQQLTTDEQAFAHWATAYGLQNLAYEGGPDTSGPNNIVAKAEASMDPQMEQLVDQYLQTWLANDGGLFMWYFAGPSNYNTPYGTWGLTDSVTDLTSPKYEGIADTLNAPAPALTVGYAVPGTIQAIDYAGSTDTTDPYPRYLHDGAFLDYLVRPTQAGTYQLTLNYAAPAAGEQVEVLVDNTPVETVTLPFTGTGVDSAWSPDDFANAQPITLQLPAGLDDVRLLVVNEGFTVNTLEFQSVSGPSLVTPPSATVAGTAVNLAVLGADPGGEAGLSYTWAVTAAPVGSPTVTFSDNADNSAQNTTAQLGAAGTYTFAVTAVDAVGMSVSGSVTVTVNQVLTSVTLTPGEVTIAAGSTESFTGTALDQFGAALATQPTLTWTTTSGSVTAAGLFTAPALAGTATVHASAGSITGSATVVVGSSGNGPGTLIPFSSLSLNGTAAVTNGRLDLTTEGQDWSAASAYAPTPLNVATFTTQFTFQLNNAEDNPWTLADGIAFVLQGAGATALGRDGGDLGYGGIGNSVAVSFKLVNNAGEGPDSTGLFTDGADPWGTAGTTNLLNSGINLHSGDVFQATLSYNGTTLQVTLTDTVTGVSATQSYPVNIPALVGGNTAYVGFTAGDGALTANQDILSWTYASSGPTAPPQPPTVTASAGPVSATGTSVNLTATGTDLGGPAALTYTWSVASAPAGAPTVLFSVNGSNTAAATTAVFGQAGTCVLTVTATDAHGLTATANVTVTVAQVLTSLTLVPQTVSLPADATQQFTATALDQFGNPLVPAPGLTWSASSGTVTSAGLFTAPATAGTVTVQVTAGTLTRSSTFPVTASPPTSNGGGVDDASGFSSAGLTLNGTAAVSNGALQLTTENADWSAASAFTSTPVNVSAFTTQFTFQLNNAEDNPWTLADGIAFVLQGTGATALGRDGGDLGYGGIGDSVAVSFKLVNNAGEGPDSTGLFTDGANPWGTAGTTNLLNSGINLHSGDVFQATLSYNGTTLQVTLTDTVTGVSATQSYPVNIPALVGGNTAYVGFTAGDGALTANQKVLTWTYTSFAAFNLSLNGSAAVNGSKLQLINNGTNESASAFTSSAVPVNAFQTTFQFQLTTPTGNPWALGDGLAFVIQGAGATALGRDGGDLGYGGIGDSVAVSFKLVNNAGEGPDSTGLFSDGADPWGTGTTNLLNSGINLHSGDVFQATLSYNGTTLEVMVTDTDTGASATQSYQVNIPALVGGSTAFVGFTGGSGALTGNINVLNWTYSAV